MAPRSRKLRAVKHHYWPGNTPEEIRAFNESYNFNLHELLAEIERIASDILTAANFHIRPLRDSYRFRKLAANRRA